MNEYVEHAIQDEYPEDFSWCFGCGRLNGEGHHFRTGWEGDRTVTYVLPSKTYTAIPGFVYGGFLASFMDCSGTGSCSLALHRKNGHEPGDGIAPPRFVTASLNISYMKPTPQGKLLKAVGKVTEIHPKKWKAEIEIFAEDELCAAGEVVGVVMPASFTNQENN